MVYLPHPKPLSLGEGLLNLVFLPSPCAAAKAKAARGWRGLAYRAPVEVRQLNELP